MTFVYSASSSVEKQQIEGMLKASFDKVAFAIEGEASVKLDDTESELSDSINCKFAGDYGLQADVSTFKAALNEAAQFPKRLVGVCNTLTFKLLPLEMIDSKALRICRRLSDKMVIQTQDALSKLNDVLLDLDDVKYRAKTDPHINMFEILLEQIDKFHASFRVCEKNFSEEVCKLLPKLKGGRDEQEDALLTAQINLAEHQCKTALFFVKEKREQIDVINLHIKELMDRGFEKKSILPPRTQAMDRERLGFLIDLSVMDEKEEMHPLMKELKSLPKKKKKKVNRYRWWKDEDIVSQIEQSHQLVESNNFVDLKCDYWMGFKPEGDELEDDNDESDEEDSSSKDDCVRCIFVHHKTDWVPLQGIPTIADLSSSTITANEISIKWGVCQGANKYVITATQGEEKLLFYKKERDTSALFQFQITNNFHEFTDLVTNTIYTFQVTALSDRFGASQPSEELIIRTVKLPSIAHRMFEAAKTPGNEVGRIRKDNNLVLNGVTTLTRTISPGPRGEKEFECVQFVDVAPGFNSKEPFGKLEDSLVFVLTGETGSGKSTHINAMVNYLYGVELDDDFRILLVDDSGKKATGSVTQHITVYKLRFFKEMTTSRKSILLVDSPGFGDTRGPKADTFITNAFAMLFQELPHLNCVGLVQNATTERLTDRGKAVITNMLELFSKEIKDNLVPVCTFADSGRPLCIDGLKEDNVPFSRFVKVQNALFSSVSNKSGDGQVRAHAETEMYWNLAVNGIKALFDCAEDMILRPLDPSKDVLKKRQHLQETLHLLSGALSKNAAQVTNIINQINALVEVLGSVPTEKVKVMTPYTKREDFKTSGTYVTLCSKCNNTCHIPCVIPDDKDKAGCAAINNGYCNVCPGNCHWKVHHNASYKWVTGETEEEIVPQDLIDRWAGKQGSAESAILESINGKGGLRDEQTRVNEMMQKMVKIQDELREQALRNNPGALLVYINGLIEAEKKRGSSDGVIESLMTAKENLRLAAGSRKELEKETQKQVVMNKIITELTRRSLMTKEARVTEESTSSSFYDEVYDLLPQEIKAMKETPGKLQKSWLKSFPPFKESLKNIGIALKILIHY